MWEYITIGVVALFFLMGVRLIRPTHRGVVETLGKYTSYREPGFNWIVPIIQSLKMIDITERMANVDPQEIITKERLNAEVDLVIYYKVKADEQSVKSAFYNVQNFKTQIISLAQTTARNVIGDMEFKEVNSERSVLNKKLADVLSKETKSWGIDIVRVELMQITPPKTVQESMNKIIEAQNTKDASTNIANAREIEADGIKRAAIKSAEGSKQAAILEADGIGQARITVAKAEAQRIQLVNQAAQTYFVGPAVQLRQIEMTENALKDNAKVVVTQQGITPSIFLGDLPVKDSGKKENTKK